MIWSAISAWSDAEKTPDMSSTCRFGLAREVIRGLQYEARFVDLQSASECCMADEPQHMGEKALFKAVPKPWTFAATRIRGICGAASDDEGEAGTSDNSKLEARTSNKTRTSSK